MRVFGSAIARLGWTAILAVSTVAFAEPSRPAPWLLVSDIHFDPLANPAAVADLIARPASEWRALLERASGPLSAYGADTNYPLLASALREMQRQAGAPAVLVIAGDLLAHHLRERFESTAPRGADFESFAEKTSDFLALELAAAFPHAQFVLALGNNDSTCGDYCVEPGGTFLTHLAATWAPLVDREGRAPGFRAAFAAGSLYTAALPLPGSPQVVVLDSVLWSAHHEGDAAAGGAELTALTGALAQGKPPWRWFVAHVPPGFDAFSSAKRGEPTAFLTADSASHLLASLTSPAARAAEVITGHSHHASFEVLGSGASAVPMVSLPSISPIFRNNPAFEMASVDSSTGLLTAMTTYVRPLDHAGLGWIAETQCGSEPFTGQGLAAYQSQLVQSSGAAATYLGCFATQSSVGAVREKDWPWYLCADTAQTRDGYCLCLAAQHAANACH